MNISITSDGTKAGTKVSVDGVEIQNLYSLHMYLDSWDAHVGFGYSIKEEDKLSHMEVRTHYCFDPSIASVRKADADEVDVPADLADYRNM